MPKVNGKKIENHMILGGYPEPTIPIAYEISEVEEIQCKECKKIGYWTTWFDYQSEGDDTMMCECGYEETVDPLAEKGDLI